MDKDLLLQAMIENIFDTNWTRLIKFDIFYVGFDHYFKKVISGRQSELLCIRIKLWQFSLKC